MSQPEPYTWGFLAKRAVQLCLLIAAMWLLFGRGHFAACADEIKNTTSPADVR